MNSSKCIGLLATLWLGLHAFEAQAQTTMHRYALLIAAHQGQPGEVKLRYAGTSAVLLRC